MSSRATLHTLLQRCIMITMYMNIMSGQQTIICTYPSGCNWKCQNGGNCDDNTYICPSSVTSCSLTCKSCINTRVESSASNFSIECVANRGCINMNITSETSLSNIQLSCTSSLCSIVTLNCPPTSSENCQCIDDGQNICNNQVNGIWGTIINPTTSPTNIPSITPSTNPTISPTSNPSILPTSHPTKSPSIYPTISPITSTTAIITNHPTSVPTKSPSMYPTKSPSIYPTISPIPSITAITTIHPTSVPTKSPSMYPTTSSITTTASTTSHKVTATTTSATTSSVATNTATSYSSIISNIARTTSKRDSITTSLPSGVTDKINATQINQIIHIYSSNESTSMAINIAIIVSVVLLCFSLCIMLPLLIIYMRKTTKKPPNKHMVDAISGEFDIDPTDLDIDADPHSPATADVEGDDDKVLSEGNIATNVVVDNNNYHYVETLDAMSGVIKNAILPMTPNSVSKMNMEDMYQSHPFSLPMVNIMQTDDNVNIINDDDGESQESDDDDDDDVLYKTPNGNNKTPNGDILAVKKDNGDDIN